MLDHSHLLLGDLAEENSHPRPVQAELTREIEELRNRKTSFVEDLINLKSFKEKQFSKVENLREEIMRENHVLYNLHRETRGLKHDLEEREKEGGGPSSQKRKTERKREDCLVAASLNLRAAQNYQENPMPNFNFPPVPGQAESSYLKYNSRKPLHSSPYDPKLHLQSPYDPAPPPPACQYQSDHLHYWASHSQPPPQYSYSTSCLASTFSSCEACGKPANFLCSACKTVHYCTPRCQVGQSSG